MTSSSTAATCSFVAVHVDDASQSVRLEHKVDLPDGSSTPSMRDMASMYRSGANALDTMQASIKITDVSCGPSPSSSGPSSSPSSSAPSRSRPQTMPVEQVVKRNMASSCAPNWDVSDATQLQAYRCHYRGPIVDEHGHERHVRLDRLTGRLATCDATEEDRNKTHEDIINIVHRRLGGDAHKVDRSHITCDVFTSPLST